MWIDGHRREHQEDQLEDALMDSRKCAISAGGIDGGFSSKEELMEMLTGSLSSEKATVAQVEELTEQN